MIVLDGNFIKSIIAITKYCKRREKIVPLKKY